MELIIKWCLTVISIILIAVVIAFIVIGKYIIDFFGGFGNFLCIAHGFIILVLTWTDKD